MSYMPSNQNHAFTSMQMPIGGAHQQISGYSFPVGQQLVGQPMIESNMFQNEDFNRALGLASGEMLSKARNSAYINLLLEVMELKNKVLSLEVELRDAKLAHQSTNQTKLPLTMPENFIHSTSPLVDSSRLILLRAQIFERVLPDAMKNKQIPCLKQEDYPLVKYWSEETFREWYETNGGGPTPTGELSKKLYFLEDGSGQLLAKKHVDHVCRRTKGIFDTIRSELKELLGDTWTHADYEFQKLLYAQLCHEFPEFVYCDDNWKIRSYLSHWQLDKTQAQLHIPVSTIAATTAITSVLTVSTSSQPPSAATIGNMASSLDDDLDNNSDSDERMAIVTNEENLSRQAKEAPSLTTTTTPTLLETPPDNTSAEDAESVTVTQATANANNHSVTVDIANNCPSTSGTIQTSEAQAATVPQPAKQKKVTLRVTNSSTPMNLAKKEWIAQGKPLNEFPAFWTGLDDAGKKAWTQKSKDMKKRKVFIQFD
ncbi:hypothetical protein M378DRAFT_18162 [Amanita muscaria Koide BX008]|uniref:Uncharacterized protein n=1 Tax=Amanita muscaria (strain Koide BX008) TaxID=946122 RepID=A0A0C2RXZ7_AMAMK|nr:hypothetical protein M378DRAFT_18162 [Amanita muscaria Koide BX008]